MKKNTISIEKKIYREMVDILLQFADDKLPQLTPGNTYTAADIRKMLGWSRYDPTPAALIKNELGTFAVSSSKNIFKQIAGYERCAGLTGKKAHRWVIPDERKVAYSDCIAFPKKKQMNKVASIIKKMSKTSRVAPILSIADGCIRSLIPYCDIDTQLIALRIEGKDYNALPELPHLHFKFNPDALKNIYGECKLTIYMDDTESTEIPNNPYNTRVVIENADGWCVSSNEVIPITDEYIRSYDEQFSTSYEDDSIPSVQNDITAGDTLTERNIANNSLEQLNNSSFQEPHINQEHSVNVSINPICHSETEKVADNKTDIAEHIISNPGEYPQSQNYTADSYLSIQQQTFCDKPSNPKCLTVRNRHVTYKLRKRYRIKKRKKGRNSYPKRYRKVHKVLRRNRS